MLLVITGEVKSGKTEFLRRLVRSLRGLKVVGIIAPTIVKEGEIQGYEALLLPGGERFQLVARSGEGDRVGRRYVLLKCAKERIRERFKKPVEADFYVFDEFGPLELTGKGLVEVFNGFYSTGKDMAVVVRKSVLEKFLKRVNRDDIRVVGVGEVDPVNLAELIRRERR